MTDLLHPSFFHGYYGWEERENGVFLTRFPQETLTWYKQEGPRRNMRACSYAGVRLEAETDSAALTIWLEFLEGDQPFASFGLMIDGQVQPVISLTPEELQKPVTISLDGQPHRVTVYFPHLLSCVIKSVTAEGSATPIQPLEKRYYAFGDSLTQGMTGENPANTYPAQVARFFDMEHWNFGVGGIQFNENTLGGMDALPMPHLVTVALGTNDWFAGKTENMSSFLKSCAAYLKKIDALYPAVPTFILLPTWRADEIQSMKRGNLQNIRENIARVAAFYPNMQVIDCQDMFPHDVNLFADQLLHPNDEGYGHYGENLCQAMKERL